jgi:YHS domain-containing protein
MSHTRIAHGLTIAALLAAVGPAFGQQQEDDKTGKQDQARSGEKEERAKPPLCPVMNEPVDFAIKTMTDEGPVYFCCSMCIRKFEQDPAHYADKVARQREQLRARERIQATCPISGKPVDKDVYVEKDGEKVYFCCVDCKPKYKANPGKHHARLEASYTYQTRCPVMGGKISPTVFTDLPTGERVFFCCRGCDRKFLADPDKYVKNLEKQGVHINVKRLKKELERKDASPPETPGNERADGHDHP